MRRKVSLAAWSVLCVLLLLANVKIATAHRWSSWHQPDRTVHVYNFATQHALAEVALNDWDSHTNIQLPRENHHTELSVFDGNFGATGWWGLASIEETGFGWWDCWWWCHIDHAHARFNSYYGGSAADIQGVLCQEIGHTFGLQHSNTGDCMGKGYYNNINVTGPHNWADINSMY